MATIGGLANNGATNILSPSAKIQGISGTGSTGIPLTGSNSGIPLKSVPNTGIPLANNGGYLPANLSSGLLQQHTPTTPVKSITDTSGNTVAFHAPPVDTSGGKGGYQGTGQYGTFNGVTYSPPDANNPYGSASGTSTASPVNTPPKAPPLTLAGQAPGVLASGQQTGNEKQTQTNLQNSGQLTDLEKQILNGSAVNNANQALTDFRQREAQAYGNVESQAIPLNFQQGREQVLARQFASQENALQQGISNALTNQGQQFGEAQSQANRGLSAAQGAYTGSQTQAQRATGANENVFGAVAPVTQFGVLTNPVIGEPINGQSATNAAIQGGTIQGLQSGAQTAAATQGGIQSQQATQIAGYQSALQQGQNLQAQLADLITTFGLNPSDLNVANQALQKIASNVSDPHYKQLENYINDIANTYAQVLTPPGGSSTDTSRGIATSMLDATASGASLIDTMKSLDNAAKAKIAGVSTTGGNASAGGTLFGSFF